MSFLLLLLLRGISLEQMMMIINAKDNEILMGSAHPPSRLGNEFLFFKTKSWIVMSSCSSFHPVQILRPKQNLIQVSLFESEKVFGRTHVTFGGSKQPGARSHLISCRPFFYFFAGTSVPWGALLVPSSLPNGQPDGPGLPSSIRRRQVK